MAELKDLSKEELAEALKDAGWEVGELKRVEPECPINFTRTTDKLVGNLDIFGSKWPVVQCAVSGALHCNFIINGYQCHAGAPADCFDQLAKNAWEAINQIDDENSEKEDLSISQVIDLGYY